MNETTTRITGNGPQCMRITSIGEFVEIDNRLWRNSKPVENKIGTDEAGTACC